MQKRTLTVLILIFFLLAGCGKTSATPPLVYLVTDGGLVDGFQSSYCWDGGIKGTLCVDSIEPYFETSTTLSPGSSIQLQLDAPLPDSVTLSLSRELFGDELVSESVPVTEQVTWSPAVDAGEYILTVHANWPQGNVAYWFSITLQ